MATKGTAAKSATGAAMSKYDVEVEGRLQKLEVIAHEKCDAGGSVSPELEAKIEELYEWYLSVKARV